MNFNTIWKKARRHHAHNRTNPPVHLRAGTRQARPMLAGAVVGMKPLFACEVCGFLSTRASEFTRVDGIRVDKECAERISDGSGLHTVMLGAAKLREKKATK